MIVKTKGLGMVEVPSAEIISFPEGIYGFRDAKHFALLKNRKSSGIFMWLQCTDKEDPRFAVADPHKIIGSYAPEIGNWARKVIGLEKDAYLRFVVIATVTKGARDVYFNFKCPIVINTKGNKAVQVILDDEKYPMRYYIIKDREG